MEKCVCCDCEIEDGDEVWDTDDGLLHDDCFYDYVRKFVLDIGWGHYIYGDNE